LLAEHGLGDVGSRTSGGWEGTERIGDRVVFSGVAEGPGLALWVRVVAVSGWSL
jgi:hypothetical protein